MNAQKQREKEFLDMVEQSSKLYVESYLLEINKKMEESRSRNLKNLDSVERLEDSCSAPDELCGDEISHPIEPVPEAATGKKGKRKSGKRKSGKEKDKESEKKTVVSKDNKSNVVQVRKNPVDGKKVYQLSAIGGTAKKNGREFLDHYTNSKNVFPIVKPKGKGSVKFEEWVDIDVTKFNVHGVLDAKKLKNGGGKYGRLTLTRSLYDTYFNAGVKSTVGFLVDFTSNVIEDKIRWLEELNNLKVKIKGSMGETLDINIKGTKSENLKDLRVTSKILQDKKDIVEFEYYIK